MKGFLSLIVTLGLALAVVPTAQAQFNGDRNRGNRDEVCVYHDNYYQGQEQCYRPGDQIADLGGLTRNISSIHVYGRARVRLYEGRDFQGNSIDVSNDVVDLARVQLSGSRSWNDHAGSLRVTSDNGYSGGGPYNNGPDYRRGRQATQNGICVYEDPNYRGRTECFDAGQSDTNLANTGWGDRISSIRLFGNARAVFFTNAGFGGARLVIDRDVPDLRQMRISGTGATWNDQISSIEVQGGRGRGPAYRYYDRDYRDYRNYR